MKRQLITLTLVSAGQFALAQYPSPPRGGDPGAFQRQIDAQNAKVLQGVREFNARSAADNARAEAAYRSSPTHPMNARPYGSSYGSPIPSGSYGGYSTPIPSSSYGSYGYGSPIPSGYSYGSPIPSGSQYGFYGTPSVSSGGGYRVYDYDGYEIVPSRSIELGMPRVMPSPVPQPTSVAKSTAPRKGTIVSVGNQTAPDGTFDFRSGPNGKYVWLDEHGREIGAAKTEVANNAVAPAPVLPPKPRIPTYEESLPKERYAKLGTVYANSPEVAAHAYVALVDEAIGIQSVDAPAVELPKLNEEVAKEVTKDKFHTIRALLMNSELPDLKSLSKNGAWTGRCVFRSHPNLETGAVLGFAVDGHKVKAGIVTAASAAQLAESEKNANPKKYDVITKQLAAEIQGHLATVDETGVLASRPPDDRPFGRSTLFFDGKSDLAQKAYGPGYRLATFTSTTKKTVLVAEGYNTLQPGADFVGKRVEFQEPTRYCYFTKEWAF